MTTINVRLTTSGAEQSVLLKRQFYNVQAIYLDEVLAVGWNGGVAAGAYLRIDHPQLNDPSVSGDNSSGTSILVDPLNPHHCYSNKLLQIGTDATLNNFRVSIVNAAGTPMLFTELYLILRVIHKASPVSTYDNAMMHVPEIRGADPRQSVFLRK